MVLDGRPFPPGARKRQTNQRVSRRRQVRRLEKKNSLASTPFSPPPIRTHEMLRLAVASRRASRRATCLAAGARAYAAAPVDASSTTEAQRKVCGERGGASPSLRQGERARLRLE